MKKIITIISLLACLFAVIHFKNSGTTLVVSEFNGDKLMWENIFENATSYQIPKNIKGAIAPHHLIAANHTAGFYKSLAKNNQPSTIVILGPNHYQNGKPNIQTCSTCLYETTSGQVEINKNLSDKLIKDKIAKQLDQTFIQEHAIHAHTPFISKYLPDTKILPIIIHWEIPENEVISLSNWLSENIPEDSLVLASVDFSHYISPLAADFHDHASYASIQNFDLENIYDLELDSPSSILTLLQYLKSENSQKAIRHDHTNLYQFVSKFQESTTSHHFFTFETGDIKPIKSTTIMAIPPSSDTADQGISYNWNWDPKNDNLSSQEDPLKNLRGQEDRFLTGSDILIFNLAKDIEPNKCIKHIQNSQTIALCNSSTEMQLPSDTDFNYVNYDYSILESDNYIQEINTLFNNGADLIYAYNLPENKIKAPTNKILISNPEDPIGIHISNKETKLYKFPQSDKSKEIVEAITRT